MSKPYEDEKSSEKENHDPRLAFRKIGMTSIFDKVTGESKGVTLLKFIPAKVLRHESLPDGRVVVIVEYDVSNEKTQLDTSGKPLKRKTIVKGWLVKDPSHFAPGTLLSPNSLSVGKKVRIRGTSKGKGFQGVIKRYGFAGGPRSHGSRFHRAPGSVGMRTEPGRVMPGKKMPGHMGDVIVTLRNMVIADSSPEDGLIAIYGGVPGAQGGVVFI